MPSDSTSTEPHKNYSSIGLYGRYAVAGAQCAALTHTILVPVDVAKTRIQLSPNVYTKGLTNTLVKIFQAEGTSALFLGLAPTLIGYYLQGACKFGFFEVFKAQAPKVFGAETASAYSVPIYFASSATAEMIASFCLCPWEAVRIRIVSQPDYAKGMIPAFARMAGEEGLWGFYRGLGPILLKQVPYTMTQLTAFAQSVDFVYEKVLPSVFKLKKEDLGTSSQLGISVSCGVFAGVVSAIASHPADTILSRINKAVKAGQSRPTVSGIAKELGFKGLWLGLQVRCIMVGALSAGMFFIYDATKVFYGLPTTSGLKKH